jgi:hypothetical protein
VEAIGLHAGRTSHPTVKEFCCGYPPIKVKDIRKEYDEFSEIALPNSFPRNPFSNPPILPRFRVVSTFPKRGKGGLII